MHSIHENGTKVNGSQGDPSQDLRRLTDDDWRILWGLEGFYIGTYEPDMTNIRHCSTEVAMRCFMVYQVTDSGGWGSGRHEICCVRALTRSLAKTLAMELLFGNQLSILSHWDVEEVMS